MKNKLLLALMFSLTLLACKKDGEEAENESSSNSMTGLDAKNCDYFDSDKYVYLNDVGMAYYFGEPMNGCLCDMAKSTQTKYQDGKPQSSVSGAYWGPLTFGKTFWDYDANEITSEAYYNNGSLFYKKVYEIGNRSFNLDEENLKEHIEFYMNGNKSRDGAKNPIYFSSEGQRVNIEEVNDMIDEINRNTKGYKSEDNKGRTSRPKKEYGKKEYDKKDSYGEAE